MKLALYEQLPLEHKKLVVNFVSAHLRNYGTEVPGELLLLRCVFAGIPEELATEVIVMETKLYGQKLV